MSPKADSKKSNKAHHPNQGRRGAKQALVSPVPVVRASPAIPIPPLVTLMSPPELKTVKKWCFDRTPVYYTPQEPWPSLTLNKNAIVQLTGQSQMVSTEAVPALWLEIAYETYDARTGIQWVTGWINDAYLDDYNEKFPDSGVRIPNPTPNPNDAQQYMILEGRIRYNLCGEFCVAFIVEDDIDSVLTKWKENSPSSYNMILAGGRDNTTSENDLKNMLSAVLGEYGYGSADDQLISLRNKLTYPINPASLLQDLQKMLATHCLIAGVTIDDSGELIGKENPRIKHWIVLDRLTHNGNRAEIYNSFPNRREECTFTEFYNSCSTNSGIWVKRKKARAGSPVEDFPNFKVAIANPNPLYRAAQYIDVDGAKKTNLCGEFCVAFILGESIHAVLEQWKEIQPKLYADLVGGNKPTGISHLITILKVYGYNTAGDFREFANGVLDPSLQKPIPSPGRIAKMLETHFLIAGVNISGITGKLKPGNDVRHWVVVDKLAAAGKNRGWVELYNPFPNCWEEYSYREFINSAGYWSGLWVKREILPVYTPQVVVTPYAEEQPQKAARIGQWTEGQLLAVIRQKSRSGKSLNKLAAELAELSGWKKQAVLSRLKMTAKAGSAGIWTESRLRQEISRRLQEGRPAGKISVQLANVSGWKKREIASLLKSVKEAQKWTEAQLLAAISERLKSAKPANKIMTELKERSGWRAREIFSRLKQLREASKWTEAQLREEMERHLDLGKPVNKISSELSGISGWKKWEISKMLKSLKNVKEAAEKKKMKKADAAEEPVIVIDPNTIVQASKPLAEFVKWQDSLLAQNPKLYRVRKWGDPVMVKYGFDVNQINSTNFQAVGLYNNGSQEFGGVSNFIRISHAEVMRLKAMQIEDEYVARIDDWRSQKMNWLCKFRGTIYFFDEKPDQWQTAPCIRWGTIALGGNLVQVLGTQVIQAKMRNGVTGKVKMACLNGFKEFDWRRPLDELLAEGLVHRCFCAYKSNNFGDSPKGIVYSPFYSVANRDFAGLATPTALYIPVEWLEPKDA